MPNPERPDARAPCLRCRQFAVVTLAVAAGATLPLAPLPEGLRLHRAEAQPSSGGTESERLTAARLVALLQAFYDRVQNMEADFYQTYYHRVYDRYERSRGRVVFQKPGKMRWDYQRPAGKRIVSDGRQLMLLTPGEEGEPPQAVIQPVGEQQLPAVFAFLLGKQRLSEAFDARLLDPRRQGFPGGYVLQLRPRRPNPHYDRVLFYVVVVRDPRSGRRAAIIKRVLVVDPEGNRNRFDLSNMRFNRPVPESRFRVEPPAGARVVRP